LFEQGIGFHEQGFSTRKWRAFRVEDGRSFGDAAIDVRVPVDREHPIQLIVNTGSGRS